jgi:hypothetical protein
MAEIQQTQTLPAPFIEALGKTYGRRFNISYWWIKRIRCI